jgi:hypothetical protein
MIVSSTHTQADAGSRETLLPTSSRRGSLIVVGTGIKSVSHLTTETRVAIESAERLFYLVADPVTIHWLRRQNPTAESLFRFYARGKDRLQTYLQMVEHVVSAVRSGQNVCVAFYGHPGVFSFPPHEAIRRVRAEGHLAKMLPGISSEDCLLADFGLDPGTFGCQSFEASDFLINHRVYDDTSLLILWQIGVIGVSSLPTRACSRRGLRALVAALRNKYQGSHEVLIYEAPVHLVVKPKVIRCALTDLASSNVTPISTLCIPPNSPRPSDEVLYDYLFRVRKPKPQKVRARVPARGAHESVSRGSSAQL